MQSSQDSHQIFNRENVVTKLVDIVIDFTIRFRKEKKVFDTMDSPFTHEISKLINYVEDLCNILDDKETVSGFERSEIYWFLWEFNWGEKFVGNIEPFPRNEVAQYILNWNDLGVKKQIEQRHPFFFKFLQARFENEDEDD